MRRHIVPVVLLIGICSTWAAAAPDVIVDEWGNSFGPIPVHVLPTPPGGPLTYALPFPVIPGDVVLLEKLSSTEVISDLIRFPFDPNGLNGLTNLMLFYSDLPQDPAEVPPPADIGLPQFDPASVVRIPEVGVEGNDGAIYTPLGNQPGALPGTAFPTYLFISDSVVPLPTSVGLGAAGFGLMGVLRVIRGRRAA